MRGHHSTHHGNWMNGRRDRGPELQTKFPNRKRRKKRREPFQKLRSTAALPSLVLPEEPQATKCPGHRPPNVLYRWKKITTIIN